MPEYEWVIQGGPSGGAVELHPAQLGLFNATANDFVVYYDRPWGINMRWWEDARRIDRRGTEHSGDTVRRRREPANLARGCHWSRP